MTDESIAPGMPAYRVLARKYRPQRFEDLIGHEAMVRTLRNAITSNRIAQAYMLTGVRGIGKTTTARLIARALNYPGQPSVVMPEMTAQDEAILQSRHIDVIEMDAASNTGVDNMREIIDSVRYAPLELRYKIYIIDEVHMLSKSAFNALLKTLEEPPPHVKFIFATTEIRKVPVTILSRCQRFDLKRINVAELMAHYGRIAAQENISVDEEALRMIARAAEGSVRDGLSLLDQAIAYGGDRVKAQDVSLMLGLSDRTRVVDLFAAIMAGHAATALELLSQQYEAGGDPETILSDLADFVHWVTRLKLVPQSAREDAARNETERVKGLEFAQNLNMAHLTRAWALLLKGLTEVAGAPQPYQAAEMLVVRLCYGAELPQGEALLAQARTAVAPHAKGLPNAAPLPVTDGAMPAPAFKESSLPQARPPVVKGGGDTMAAVQRAPIPPPERSDEHQSGQAPPLTSFQAFVQLAHVRRDVKLKGELERFVRPVQMKQGQLEIALEAGAPPGLGGEISRKLEAWTGQRWLVSLASTGGAKPLRQQELEAKDQAIKRAREDSDVKAILQSFPGAVITGVREPEVPVNLEEHDEESR